MTRVVYSTYRPSSFSSTYTGVMIDMIDRTGTTADGRTFDDRVSGYTAHEVENAIRLIPSSLEWDLYIGGFIGFTPAYTLTGWRYMMSELYSNSTESELEDLFDYWEGI